MSGKVSAQQCSWISNTQIDIVAPPWPGSCAPCAFSIIYDGVEKLSAEIPYFLPDIKQTGRLPREGGTLTVSGEFPEVKNGWKYKVFMNVLGQSTNTYCENVQRASSGTELTCDYLQSFITGGCVSNSRIYAQFVNDEQTERKLLISNFTGPLCYVVADDTADVTPRWNNLNPKSIVEGTSATFDVTLSIVPTGGTTETVQISSIGTPSQHCTLSPPTLTFDAPSWQTPQQVKVSFRNDSRIQSKPRSCQIKILATQSTKSVEVDIPIIDDDSAGIYVLRPRSGGGEDYKLSFASYILQEGGNISYKLAINSQPLGSVTITPSISSDKSSRLKLVSQAVTFDMNNWQTPQTVNMYAPLRPEYDGDVEVEITHNVEANADTDPKYHDYLKDNGNIITLISVQDVHSVGIKVSESFLSCKVGEKAVISLLKLTSRPTSPVNLEIKVEDDASREMKISHASGGNQSAFSTLVNNGNYLEINSVYSIDCNKKGSFTLVVSSTSDDSSYNTNSLPTEDPIRLNVGAVAKVPTVTASDLLLRKTMNGQNIVLSWNNEVFDKSGQVVPFDVDISVCSDILCKDIVATFSRRYNSADRSFMIGAKDMPVDTVDATFTIDLELGVFYIKLGSDIYEEWSDSNKPWISASQCSEQEYLNVSGSPNDPRAWECVRGGPAPAPPPGCLFFFFFC
jgi:hypothetical protein